MKITLKSLSILNREFIKLQMLRILGSRKPLHLETVRHPRFSVSVRTVSVRLVRHDILILIVYICVF